MIIDSFQLLNHFVHNLRLLVHSQRTNCFHNRLYYFFNPYSNNYLNHQHCLHHLYHHNHNLNHQHRLHDLYHHNNYLNHQHRLHHNFQIMLKILLN